MEQRNGQKRGLSIDQDNDMNYSHSTGNNRLKDAYSMHSAPAAIAVALEKERRQSKTATAQRRGSRKSSISSLARLKQLTTGIRPAEEARGLESSQGNLRFVSSKSSQVNNRRLPEPNRNVSSESQNNEPRSVKHPNHQLLMTGGSAKGGLPRHNQVAPQVHVTSGERAQGGSPGELSPENRSMHGSIDGDDDHFMDIEAIRMDVSRYADVLLSFKGTAFDTKEIRLEYKVSHQSPIVPFFRSFCKILVCVLLLLLVFSICFSFCCFVSPPFGLLFSP